MVIINALIIALIVFFIKATTWKGHIFEWAGKKAKRYLPEKLYKPLIGCSLCMTFWWGYLTYYTLCLLKIPGFMDSRFKIATVTIFVACGWGAILLLIAKINEELKKIRELYERT